MARDFVSCDWGTTRFRLRWNGHEERTEEGAARLAVAGGDRTAAFRATLERGLERLGAPRELPVLISGMASSSIGWRELPYARLPFSMDGRDAVWQKIDARGIYLLSGLRGDTEIMRGEETEALGAVALLGSRMPPEAVLLMPGTHSKHVSISGRRIVDFQTYLSGELFDVLARHSVLRHSTNVEAPFDAEAFREGVRHSRAHPLSSAIFRVRTRHVLDKADSAANASFLSGILVGAELEMLRDLGWPVILCANERLQPAYRVAAEEAGLRARLQVLEAKDVEQLAVLGQRVMLDRILAREKG